MGRYTAEANTTLHLDDGQIVSPGASFETEFRPEQESSLLAAGAITTAEAVQPEAEPESTHVQPAGDPGVKE